MGLRHHSSNSNTTASVTNFELLPWQDEDGDGYVDQQEFRKALPALGLSIDRQSADELYTTFDADGSGMITLDELQRQLRPRGEYEHVEFETEAKNAIELRSELIFQEKRSGVAGMQDLNRLGVQMESDVPLIDQIKQALAGGFGKVLDIFKEWDEDGSAQAPGCRRPALPWGCLRSQLSIPRGATQIRHNHQARVPPRAAAAWSAPPHACPASRVVLAAAVAAAAAAAAAVAVPSP